MIDRPPVIMDVSFIRSSTNITPTAVQKPSKLGVPNRMIKKISIKNVRGIEDKTFEFISPTMLPNKVHLLIAPNGFGKSSIATAFNNLKPQSLRLKETQIYKHETARIPQLEIEYEEDGVIKTLAADPTQNQLSSNFDTYVIKSPGKLRATQRPTGSGFQVPIAELVIEDIELCSVPEKAQIPYSYNQTKREFGANGKVLPNISKYLENLPLIDRILGDDNLRRLTLRGSQKKIEEFIQKLNLLDGLTDQILEKANAELIHELECPELHAVGALFDDLTSPIEKILAAIQITKIHASNGKLLLQTSEWLRYEERYERVKKLLNSCNPNEDWIKLEIKRTGNRLLVSFPKPEHMSNGQRDLLCFITQFIKFELNTKKANSILIIDEIFDYLDYQNLIACQYFLSKLITNYTESGRKIFPIILTHLDPSVFNSFVFSKKLQKNHYLDKCTEINRNIGLHKIILTRLNQDFEQVFANYFAHHCLSDYDAITLFQKYSLKLNWSHTPKFREYCASEANKYLISSAEPIDYLAVCLHLRISIEKSACDQLNSLEKKTHFVSTHKTVAKLDFAIENGAIIPEVHYLLATLYNSALHPSTDQSDFASAVISRLRNTSIKAMIKDALA